MIRGIHHISMHSRNFDRMIRFYCEGFGFVPVGREFRWENNPSMDKGMGLTKSSGRGIMLKAGNCFLEMFEFYTPQGRDAPPLQPQDRGYTHFCVDVTDIAAERERLGKLGMTFVHSEIFDNGVTKAVYGKDIDGNIIELMETGSGVEFEIGRLGGFKIA
jgi:catechol 2,3-dioxygenase-like lactoylglutathione lyase family enzyme